MTFGNYNYTASDGQVTITGYVSQPTGDLVIPDTLDGMPVVGIGLQAFGQCSGLTSVTFPSSVTSLGSTAFGFCSGLTSVTLPPNLTSIGDSAFAACSGIVSISIPAGVTKIGNSVFSSCSSLQNVTFLGPVTSIGNSAFYGCSNLTNFTIPSTVTSLGTYVFVNCVSLTGVTIPAGVTTIQSGVFVGCTGLQSITIPGTVSNVGYQAFYNCTGLTSVTISSGVQTIGSQAFRNCFGLTSVTIPASVTTISSLSFYNCTSLTEAIFLGDAPPPATTGTQIFDLATLSPIVTIYHTAEATGFDVSPWTDYAQGISTFDPLAEWLTTNGLPVDSDLLSDSNHDGVSLLMAYALNLNPNLNLSDALPQPVFSAGQMSLTYLEATDDVTYVVETSTDALNWSAEGVTLSELDPSHYRTATVPMTGPKRFMRISVSR